MASQRWRWLPQPNTNGNGNVYSDTDGGGDGDVYSNCDGNGYGDGYCYGNRGTEVDPDAQAAAHATSTPISSSA